MQTQRDNDRRLPDRDDPDVLLVVSADAEGERHPAYDSWHRNVGASNLVARHIVRALRAAGRLS